MTQTHRRLTTRIDADATLSVEIGEAEVPRPTGNQVLIRVEAAPIHPSDIRAAFGAADLTRADYAPGRVIAPIPEAVLTTAASIVGKSRPFGNECAGTVVAAGDAPAAQVLLGKRVAAFTWTSYAQFTLADAAICILVPEGVSAEQSAAAFVNPLTALGFVESMRQEGHTALVHTAAASVLGQMLVRICQEDGIPLVNIVRNVEQVALLRGIGAEHVLDSTAPHYAEQLIEAIAETGATMAFDAIGGGSHNGQILEAMEAVALRATGWSLYGSNVRKRLYIYGSLDTAPTVLNRTFGMQWDVGGWLLMPVLAQIGAERAAQLRQRVGAGLTTTFATTYARRVTLDQMIAQDAVEAFTRRKTGVKYLLLPNG